MTKNPSLPTAHSSLPAAHSSLPAAQSSLPAAQSSLPAAQGLYDPRFEKDACGIGFVAHVDGRPRRQIVTMALAGLAGVKHRGAVAADGQSGDGAGILTQIPRDLLFARAIELGHSSVKPENLGLAFLFLDPNDADERTRVRQAVQDACDAEGIQLLGWREVPID
ncbi:MAG: glutamate synthase (NADPH/NADH) large chain, partial [Nitriliruptoraceae bacterium]